MKTIILHIKGKGTSDAVTINVDDMISVEPYDDRDIGGCSLVNCTVDEFIVTESYLEILDLLDRLDNI